MRMVIPVVVVLLSVTLSGCKSADNGNSKIAEFPTVEKWWK